MSHIHSSSAYSSNNIMNTQNPSSVVLFPATKEVIVSHILHIRCGLHVKSLSLYGLSIYTLDVVVQFDLPVSYCNQEHNNTIVG